MIRTTVAASRLTLLACLSLAAPPLEAQTWENCTPITTIPGKQAGGQFGWIGVSVGDVDADGVGDYLVTAPFFGANAGRVLVYSGASGQKLYGTTGLNGETLGWSAHAAGELTGDGFAEYAAGAPGTGPGAGYVWSGVDGSLHFSVSGEANGDGFGSSATNAGDLDGDGIDDIAFGAPNNGTGGAGSGRVYVHSGSDGALIRTFDARAPGESFGSAVAGVGDRNADSVPDLMVGALTGGPSGTGRAYVISGVDGSTLWTFDGDATAGGYGQFFLGPCGDVDADGVEDLYVSDFTNSALGPNTGRAFIYRGTDGSLLYTITGEGPNDGFSIGRAWAGDIDGNGHDDLVFGHWTNSKGGAGAGRVSIFRGEDGSKLFSWTSDIPGTGFGYDAAGIDDLDGDGVTDFLLTGGSQNGGLGVAYVMSPLDPQPPTNYCDSTPNSVGPGATMDYRRSTSIAANSFRLRVNGAPVNVPGVFFYGFNTVSNPFGAGTICVGLPRYRLGPPQMTGASGAALRDLDFTQGPLAAGGGAAFAGVATYFQFLYRDPSGPAAADVTLSDGLQVIFCP